MKNNSANADILGTTNAYLKDETDQKEKSPSDHSDRLSRLLDRDPRLADILAKLATLSDAELSKLSLLQKQ